MDPFVGEIRIFTGNFAPVGWAFCHGQLLPISQNTALFSLLGTTYGGDGMATFALPDLRGRIPMHPGNGPGLQLRLLGELGGSETVALLTTETPAHSHALRVSSAAADSADPTGRVLANGGGAMLTAAGKTDTPASASAIAPTGGGLSHNNLMPSLVLNFIIATQGIFPPRP